MSYKVGKVTKAELNKCKTIEEKMEWLGKVLGQAIFKNDMNYAVWVNVQKNNIIETLEKEIAELKAQIEKMKCCENCKYCEFKIVSDGSTRAICTRLKGDVCLSNNYDNWELKE